MKLKKIASLMLAGVMAVSMLAGCSGNGSNNNDNNDDPVVNTGLTGNVIAALDKDTTDVVPFAEDASLKTALEKMVKDAGVGITGNVTEKELTEALLGIDGSLGEYGGLSSVYTGNSGSEATDKEEETSVWVYVLNAPGVDDSYAVNQIAAQIENKEVAFSGAGASLVGNVKCADLPDQSKTYTDADGKEYWYNFEYTGKISVVEGDSATTGQNFYVVAYSVTRTPTQVFKANV